MTFELESFTKTKITDVVVLSQKNREPDANPGAALTFHIATSNDTLDYFDGALRSFLFQKNANSSTANQQDLDGVEPVSDRPNLTGIGMHVGRLHWDLELTGYSLTIDYGIGGKSNLVLDDCTLSAFKFAPKEGGTVEIQFLCESPDVAEGIFGKLATLKNREVQIKLEAPEVEAGLVE